MSAQEVELGAGTMREISDKTGMSYAELDVMYMNATERGQTLVFHFNYWMERRTTCVRSTDTS